MTCSWLKRTKKQGILMKKEEKEIELKIYSLATSLTESIIFLDEVSGSRIIPIWIGPMEAQAIAIMLSGYPSPRPMTHDLIYSILESLGYKVKKVKITKILNNTYYAQINITDPAEVKSRVVDSRPSDAIALAVRYGCPIYINENVISKIQSLNKPISKDDVEKFKQELKSLTPKDIINQMLEKRKKQNNETDKEEGNE